MKRYLTAGPVLIGVLSLTLAVLPRTGSGQVYNNAVYLGNSSCASCHAGAYRLWLGSPHSRAWVQLHSRGAMPVALAEGWKEGDPMATETGLCLGCHAINTGGNPGPVADNFHVEEGVQCEACHGPSGKRIKTAAGADSLIVNHDGLTEPTEETCLKCHVLRPSHKGVRTHPWDYDRRWKNIRHGMEK